MLLYWILCTPLFILAGFCATIAILDFNEDIKLWKAILPGVLVFVFFICFSLYVKNNCKHNLNTDDSFIEPIYYYRWWIY